jgi:hypothetical protein
MEVGAMNRKNPDLCERPYCREPWSIKVIGGNEHGHSRWTLHVCDVHGEFYGIGVNRDTGGFNWTITSRRSDE